MCFVLIPHDNKWRQYIASKKGYQTALTWAEHDRLFCLETVKLIWLQRKAITSATNPDGRFQPHLVFGKVSENEIVLWQ